MLLRRDERVLTFAEHLMASIGTALARLHLTTIIHGDLTTSNMMVRLTPDASTPYEIVRAPTLKSSSLLLMSVQVMIDFGLSSTAQFPENYAVDLYVLERAFTSTHPASEGLYVGVSLPLPHLFSHAARGVLKR